MDVTRDLGYSQNLSTGSALQRLLHARLNGELGDDEFVRAIRGTCTESEFVTAISMQIQAEPQSLQQVMALVNRLNDRGHIPADLVWLLEARISRTRPANIDGITVDLGRNEAIDGCLVDRLVGNAQMLDRPCIVDCPPGGARRVEVG